MNAGQDGSVVRRGASDLGAAAIWDDISRSAAGRAGQEVPATVVDGYNFLRNAPQTTHGPETTPAAALPFICASGLTRAQRAGRACAVPNCRRRFRVSGSSPPQVVGVTTGGRPVCACADHDPALVLEAVTVIAGSVS